MIKDNRFGEMPMQSHISISKNNISILNKTLEPMSKVFIGINKAGEYEQQVFLLYDHDVRGFFYYYLQAMRIRSNFFLRLSGLTPPNFANRARALTIHFAALLGHDWKDRLIAAP